MNQPLIYLAFANDEDSHLDLLKEESREVFEALEELDRKEYIKVQREESASVKDIFKALTRNKDRLAIFHYGGHSNGQKLQLESGAGDARGLAQLIGEQSTLKLVFLNGCANQAQVAALMAAGVKAVIATSVPIEDRKAVLFSQQFYQALAHRRNIGQAFSLAKAYLLTETGEETEIILRNLIGEEAQTSSDHDIPWGLYIAKESEEEILSWKLPFYQTISLPDKYIARIKRDFPANQYLIRLLEEIGRYNPDLYHKMVEQREDQTEKIDSSAYPQLLISSFPWPIGAQLQILFVKEWREFGLLRLRQLLSTYAVSTQLLYYILLSDVWEQTVRKKLESPSTLKIQIPTDPSSFRDTDWLSRIEGLYDHLLEQNCFPYAPEYELLINDWRKPDSSLRKAHSFLERLRSRIEDLPKADLDKLCLKVEQALALVLRQASFLSRYRMLTIRNVMIDRPRTQKQTYELDLGLLRNSDGNFLSLYQDESKRRKQTYANSRSIILTANENYLSESLDLSPFLMDRNTYVSTLQGGAVQDRIAKIYMIGWKAEDKIFYVSVDQSLYTVLEEKLYQVHTDMTQTDFDEGNNDSGQEDGEDWLSEDFSDEFEEPNLLEEEKEEDSIKAFALLKQQYDTFENDMLISGTQLSHA